MKARVRDELPGRRMIIVLLTFTILFSTALTAVIASAEVAVPDAEFFMTEVPVIRVLSETGEAEEEYEEIQISTENCMKVFQIENGKAEWRLRNTEVSEEADQIAMPTDHKKQSYELKLERRTDFFGMGAARKWMLMANADDDSLIRNSLMCEVAGKIGLIFPLESIWVELYINDVYHGLYQLCEVPDINEERVAIHPAREEFLLDAVMREDDSSDPVIISPVFGYPFELNSINYLPADQAEWLQALLGAAEAALQTGEKETIEQYFDFQSFAAGLMLYELAKPENPTEFPIHFIIKDGKIFAGAAWDFEHSCGIQASVFSGTEYERDTVLIEPEDWKEPPLWFRELILTAWFRDFFKQHYMNVQDIICNLYDNNNLGKNQIDTTLYAMPQAIAQDRKLYILKRAQNEENSAQMSETMQADALRVWLKARNEWIIDSLRVDDYPETSE